jgi:hypothetical protein
VTSPLYEQYVFSLVSGTRFALVPAQDLAVLVAPTLSEQNCIRLLAVERLELE